MLGINSMLEQCNLVSGPPIVCWSLGEEGTNCSPKVFRCWDLGNCLADILGKLLELVLAA